MYDGGRAPFTENYYLCSMYIRAAPVFLKGTNTLLISLKRRERPYRAVISEKNGVNPLYLSSESHFRRLPTILIILD